MKKQEFENETTVEKMTLGNFFRLPNGRKHMCLMLLQQFKSTDRVDRETVGKYLICFDGCKQLILEGSQTVFTITHRKQTNQ